MNQLIDTHVQNGVAILIVNNPPVNALGPGVPDAIESPALKGIKKGKDFLAIFRRL